jgi:MYXO-CTERM domain-containing protein
MRTRSLALFAALASLGLARDAAAACRTTTVPIDPSFVSTPDQPCWTEGFPLYWKNACVGYSIQQDASKQVSFNDAQNGMETAFAQWTNATCPTASVSSKASIDVRFLGPVACHQVQYNQSGGNANIIMFDDAKWPHNDSANTLGLTTVTYNINTGELYDADMEINTAQVTLTVNGPVPADGFDFLSIVTHESGHFLGLAHSPDSHATMYAHYTQGQTSMRNLSADDVQGICSIYPPDGTRNTADGGIAEGACDPTPRHGYSGTCGGGGGGCSAAPGPAREGGAAIALGLVGVALIRRRAPKKK